MSLEELLQEVIHVVCHLLLVMVKAATVRKACPSWLVDVYQVRVTVPRKLVQDSIRPVSVHFTWTIFAKQGHLTESHKIKYQQIPAKLFPYILDIP